MADEKALSMAKVVDECQSDWDKKINTVLMGYRASQQASTKQSPYFMLFQQDCSFALTWKFDHRPSI